MEWLERALRIPFEPKFRAGEWAPSGTACSRDSCAAGEGLEAGSGVCPTGAFIEPIEVWDEPRRLKFSVTSNPAPMQEWTPYHHIEPPHLHGFLVSNGGQFLLTPLPKGGTQLEGMTWYRHSLWPATYIIAKSDLLRFVYWNELHRLGLSRS